MLATLACVSTLPGQGLWKAGESVEGRVVPNQPGFHTVTLSAGQFFFAQINGIRVSLQMRDPGGVTLGEPARTVAAVVTRAGQYLLDVRTSAPAAQRYRVTILQWRESRPDDVARVEAIRALTEGYRQMETATAAGRQAALHQYGAAKEMSRKLKDAWLEARCLQGESGAHSALGDTLKALAAMNEAAELYQRLGDRNGEATVLNSAALLHAARGEHEQAFANYRKAIEHHRATGQRRTEAEVLRNMAIAHNSAGNYQTAIETYTDVLTRFRSLQDRYGEAVTLVQLGELYIALGDFDNAISQTRASIPLHQAHGDKTAQVHALSNIGEALAAQGRHTEALVQLNAAIQLSEESGLGWQHVQAKAIAAVSEQALGRLPKARLLLEESLPPMRAHGNREGTSRVLTQLGLLELQARRTKEASVHLREAMETSDGLDNPAPKAHALTALARLARAENNHAQARSYAEQALSIVEGIRTRVESRNLRALFLASRGSWYEFYVDLLMDRNDVGAAFAGVERARARSLLDMLLDNRAKPEPAMTGFQQPVVEPGTAILEYQLGETRSWLFVVTQAGITAKQLPAAGVLANEVRQIRGLLAQPGRAALGRYAQAAEKMYRICIAPAMAEIAGKQKLVIVADGALHYLPFEALLTGPATPLAYAQLPYLVRRWTVGYAPSTAAYASLAMRPRGGAGPELVAYGDPRGDLPGAAREIREIAKSFPKGAMLFQGNAVSKRNVTDSAEAARSRRVHFAAHGQIREGSAATSGILLASGSILSPADVLHLRWNADLVVLSGCETGLGPQLRGEGILGFIRAFLLAGARNVAVSLWPVSDESTVSLMAGFYQRLSKGADHADSLRQAKLDLIRSGQYAHPYYWAPFVLAGKL